MRKKAHTGATNIAAFQYPMNLVIFTTIYQLIARGTSNVPARRESFLLRQSGLQALNDGTLVKQAFDTRRIDQETEYNPRRNLQNYHRAEQFLSEAQVQKIANFNKLKRILEGLKEKFGREPEWQDSYCRVLLNTLNTALRVNQNDGDYGETQPAIGSFDYLEEMLYARYRLELNSIAKYGEGQLRDILLSKDENMTRKGKMPTYEITKTDVTNHGYDTLLEKLFGNVRATADNRNVKRTVTITIDDSFVDPGDSVAR